MCLCVSAPGLLKTCLVMYRHPTDHVMRTNASAYTGSMCIVHGLNLEIVGEDFVLTKVIN